MTFLGFNTIEWVQIISALGTFLAAIAAWKSAASSSKSSSIAEKQLKEMKEQRLKTYQPSLAFVDNLGFLVDTSGFGRDFPEPVFYLYNVGFGAAKDIKIKWDDANWIDYSKNPFLKEPKSSDIAILMVNPFQSKKEMSLSRSNVQIIQHLLPTNIDNNPLKIDVPLIPFYFILYKFKELITNGDQRGIYSYDLNFSISYRDINNDEYEEKHKITIGFSMFNKVDSELRLNIKLVN